MRRATAVIVAVLVTSCLAVLAHAKGDGVGLWMEGTVSKVRSDGQRIHLMVTGRFWFEQYRGTARSVVEVDGSRGVSAAVVQGQPFFAMSSDWRAGSIRLIGALLAILETAGRHHRPVRFELTEAKLVFGRDGGFAVADAAVLRATDADLR
jgi:hypothetical protein